MNETISYLLYFILIIIVHELGHIFTYLYYKKGFPPIQFKWYGILIGNDEYIQNFTLRQLAFVSNMGILAGLIPILLFSLSLEYYLIYFMMCIIDISNVYLAFNSKEFLDTELRYLKTIDIRK